MIASAERKGWNGREDGAHLHAVRGPQVHAVWTLHEIIVFILKTENHNFRILKYEHFYGRKVMQLSGNVAVRDINLSTHSFMRQEMHVQPWHCFSRLSDMETMVENMNTTKNCHSCQYPRKVFSISIFILKVFWLIDQLCWLTFEFIGIILIHLFGCR